MSLSGVILGLIIVTSFIFHLIILINSNLTFFSDDAIYATLARFFIKGNFLQAFHPTWPPLYPALSALVYLVTKNWEMSLRFISTLAGVSIIVPLYFFLRRTLSEIYVLLFVFSITFFEPLLKFSLLPLSDSLSTLFIISAIIVLLVNFDNSKNLLWGGVFTGLIFLTRSEGTMFFGLVLIFLLIYLLIKKKFLRIYIFIVAFFLTISPYLITTRIQLGEWTLSQKFSAQIQQQHAFALKNQTTWAQEVTSVKSPNYSSPYFRGGTNYLIDNLSFFVKWFKQKLVSWQRLFLSLFPLWSQVLILVGILNIFKKELFWKISFITFLLITAIPMTIFTTPIADSRYLLWTFPLFLYFFYLGIVTLLTFLTKEKGLLAFSPFLLSILLPSFWVEGIFNPVTIYAQTFTKIHYRSQLPQIANWIKVNSLKPRPKIMMRHEMLEFYADGETVYLPQGSLDQVISYAKSKEVNYLVAWERELAAEEDLLKLFSEDFQHPSITKVYSTLTPDGMLIIYSL